MSVEEMEAMAGKKNKVIPSPEEFLERFLPQTQSIASDLRVLIKEAVPESIEKVIAGWGVIGYHIKHSHCELYYSFIQPRKDAVWIGWKYGILLPDPDNMLEGKHLKQTRFYTIRSTDDIDADLLKAQTREGAALAVMPWSMRMHRMAEREELAREQL